MVYYIREVNTMDITDILTQLGFPAGVAAFALWNSYKHEEFLQNTLQTTIKENTTALQELKIAIKKFGGGEHEVRRFEEEN